MIPNGTRITIPDAKIKWDKGNPTGHGIVFIGSQGQIRAMLVGCFQTGEHRLQTFSRSIA